jgi:hypothetical protein
MLSTHGNAGHDRWFVKRTVLLGSYLMSFVVAFLFTSAAFEQTSVSQVAAQLMRAPETIFTPGLEGNTASQVLAIYDAAAAVAAVAYAMRASSGGYPAIMVGLSAFTAGVALLLAAGLWGDGFRSIDLASLAATAVAAILAVRWWYLAGRATSSTAEASLGSVGRVNYRLAAILMAIGPGILLGAQFLSALAGILPYVLLFGAPVLLVSYVLAEGITMRVKFARSAA